ncbi:hypothetical protein FISHEDRAFT_56366 [Fistulina hepatica ATCC 64428]|uniref:Uncharacterized protein n=1 Tax=Fistulina hepatica ATCC 64428 TaxID=1128425 RepID=A0A0D7AJ61_9AGAR|nr:hypothetical protein FISHEDRAFT_56366 [Fistulina hepatica ATCC 64428]
MTDITPTLRLLLSSDSDWAVRMFRALSGMGSHRQMYSLTYSPPGQLRIDMCTMVAHADASTVNLRKPGLTTLDIRLALTIEQMLDESPPQRRYHSLQREGRPDLDFDHLKRISTTVTDSTTAPNWLITSVKFPLPEPPNQPKIWILHEHQFTSFLHPLYKRGWFMRYTKTNYTNTPKLYQSGCSIRLVVSFSTRQAAADVALRLIVALTNMEPTDLRERFVVKLTNETVCVSLYGEQSLPKGIKIRDIARATVVERVLDGYAREGGEMSRHLKPNIKAYPQSAHQMYRDMRWFTRKTSLLMRRNWDMDSN